MLALHDLFPSCPKEGLLHENEQLPYSIKTKIKALLIARLLLVNASPNRRFALHKHGTKIL